MARECGLLAVLVLSVLPQPARALGCDWSSIAARAYLIDGDVGGAIQMDLDRDGAPDLVFSKYAQSSRTLWRMKNRGDGTFEPPVAVGQITGSMATADFNRDGVTDLALSNDYGSTWLMMGDGAGGFLPPATIATIGGDWLAQADLDGGGNPDLVMPLG